MEINKKDIYAVLFELRRIADALEKSNELHSNKFKFEKKSIIEKRNTLNNEEKKGIQE